MSSDLEEAKRRVEHFAAQEAAITVARWDVFYEHVWPLADWHFPYANEDVVRATLPSTGERLTYNFKTDALRVGKEKGSGTEHGLLRLLEYAEENDGDFSGMGEGKNYQPEGPIVLRAPYKMSELSKAEAEWARRDPPPCEQLIKVMRYDENMRRLYYVRGAAPPFYEEVLGDQEEYIAPAKWFIPVNGQLVPRWKCVSELLFGNPYGIRDLDRIQKELDAVPAGEKTIGEILKAIRQDEQVRRHERGPNYREKPLPDERLLFRKRRELEYVKKERKAVEKQIKAEKAKLRAERRELKKPDLGDELRRKVERWQRRQKEQKE